MRDAARALDDVSDHLGEVLRRADDLLVEWSKFGAQVRDQVEREAAAVGEVVETAVGRVAAAGIDRAIGERLRALTGELERIEQRARAASRAVAEQREADRRILWAVVAGIVLANALLVVLILRKPAAAPAAEPIRLDATSAPVDPAQGAAQAAPDSAQVAPAAAVGSGATPGPGAAAPATAGPSGDGAAGAKGSAAAGQGATGGNGVGAAGPSATAGGGGAAGSGGGGAASSAARSPATGAAGPPAKSAPAGAGQGGARPAEAASKASPIALPPPRPGAAHPHKKLP